MDVILFVFLGICVWIGLYVASLTDDASFSSQTHLGRTYPRQLPEEPLDGILSPELDKMVTDGLYITNVCIVE